MRLSRDGEKGGGGMEVGDGGGREIIYLSLHCHHQNDFCIKMGSDESHFKVWRERRAEAVSNRGPSAYQPNALPLGQSAECAAVSWLQTFFDDYSLSFSCQIQQWRGLET